MYIAIDTYLRCSYVAIQWTGEVILNLLAQMLLCQIEGFNSAILDYMGGAAGGGAGVEYL